MEAGVKRLEKRKKRKRLFKRIRLLFIILFLSIAVYLLLTKLPFFAIHNFSVTGNKQVKDNDIVNISGIIKGENVFKINKKNAVQRILKEPYIESVEIDRVLPDTVGIKVKEKTDQFLLEQDGKAIYIGKNAEVLSILDNKKEKEVPLIEGLTVDGAEVLKLIKFKNKKIDSNEFSEFIKGASNTEVYKLIQKISIDGDEIVTIHTKNGAKIVFGKLDNSAYKMKFLAEVLKDLNKKKVKFKLIDFTKSKRVVVEKMTQEDIEKLDEEKEEIKAEDENTVDETGEDTPEENNEEIQEPQPEDSEGQSEEGVNGEENLQQIPDVTVQENLETHRD